MSVFVTSHFRGKATFTGPLIIRDYLETYSTSNLTCQFPSFMTDYMYTNLMWSEYHMKELEYSER
jgi:hypothetical protein